MAPPNDTPPTPAPPGLPANYDPNLGVIAPGLVQPGNLELNGRPIVRNDDGTHSSEFSTSFGTDKGEVLVPTVVGGRFLTPDGKKPASGSKEEKDMFSAAQDHYKRTGQHLGIFDSSENADTYANAVHSRHERPGLTPQHIAAAGGKTLVPPTISAAPKVNMPLPEGVDPGSLVQYAGPAVSALTENIENYTPEGRAEHPVLSRVGDVTRGAKEFLFGGQAAGKPLGTSAGALDEAMALSTAVDAAKAGATVEELTEKYGPKIAEHVTELGKTFAKSAKEDLHAYRNARAPAGSTQAGKIVISPGLDPEDIEAAGGKTIKDPEPRSEDHPVVQASPESFLKKVSHESSHVFPDVVNKYRASIRAGEPIEPLEIHHDAAGNIIGANGRHRALAAVQEGVPQVPVRVINHAAEAPEERLELSGDEPTPEKTAEVKAPDYKGLGDKAGVEFRGVQKGMEGVHPGLAIYQDPQSGTSIAVKLDQFSPEKLQEHVDLARERMAGTPKVSPSGDIPKSRRVATSRTSVLPGSTKETLPSGVTIKTGSPANTAAIREVEKKLVASGRLDQPGISRLRKAAMDQYEAQGRPTNLFEDFYAQKLRQYNSTPAGGEGQAGLKALQKK